MSSNKQHKVITEVVPTGLLKHLHVTEIKPNRNNPRKLFDPVPLRELKESIQQHGVLVPITAYKIKGQEKYAILDGERRFRCCAELADDGFEITIPANIVEPPTKIAGLLYMFSIHNFRQQWELMPTAISLKTIIEELHEDDNKKISDLTGLSEMQVERCKILLSFPEKFQALSLESEPDRRVASNFWIEAYPVIKIYEDKLPGLFRELGREVLIQRLVDKYKSGKIVSVIHFRRIIEASAKAQEQNREKEFKSKLKEYVNHIELETRDTFDIFLPPRNITTAITACNDLVEKLRGLESQLTSEVNKDFVRAVRGVQVYITNLLAKMEDGTPTDDE
ncbi:MAG: parb domain-containing protein nuclease [Parcubacteria group bacterium Gr01-1014_31]|nr:MAG: parb domain-containing protein nuclease [Parcubacteria group bacterium Gr01-1014_31]